MKKQDDSYSPTEIETARAAFNQQQSERMAASGLLNSEIPSRKDIALAKLKQQFGDHLPFEEKLLQLDDDSTAFAEPLYNPNRLPAGRHSLLDIAMMELRDVKWKTTDPRVPLAAINAPLELGVNQAFNRQFDQAIASRKKGIATTVRHMIAQLPLADRQNLEHGKLEFFQTKTYQLGMDFTSRTLHEKDSRLLVKASGTGADVLYGIDLKKGSIETVPLSELNKTRERNANKQAVLEPFAAASVDATEFGPKPAGSPAPLPVSFSSARSQAIADAFVEHLEVDSAEVVKHARGASSLDLQKEHEWKVADFFLNLIPLRSAIVNFRDGNYADGVMDLAMDVFGFLTAGAGVAAKVAKVSATATTAANRALQTAKIIGVATIGAFNPAGGVGDLLVGAGRLAAGGAKVTARVLNSAGNAGLALVTEGIARARGVSAGYNLLEASRHYGAAAKGTFKVADQSLEGAAIVHKGKWHAYDPVKKTAYGPPRDDFNPLNTLMPSSPNVNISRVFRPFDSHRRFDPINTNARPPRVRKPLPEGEYAASMKGKLEADHFKPETKAATFAKFLKEMNEHYAGVKAGNIPPRPPVPEIPKPLGVSELIVEALKVSDGAVFGEAHNQMASFKVLYENAETLKAQGVKTVYFEGMIDHPMGPRDDGISVLGKTRLPRTNPTLDQLMKKLADNGIEVVPIDHYYLTRHKDVRGLLGPTSTGFGSVRRLEEFNYYAAQTIKATSNGDKWVALVGNAHMKTSEGVPGLAELTGSLGIGVFNRTDGQASVGMRSTRHVPDPAKPLQATDWPGDLHIFKRV